MHFLLYYNLDILYMLHFILSFLGEVQGAGAIELFMLEMDFHYMLVPSNMSATDSSTSMIWNLSTLLSYKFRLNRYSAFYTFYISLDAVIRINMY